jgi:signal transduction histidine kinase
MGVGEWIDAEPTARARVSAARVQRVVAVAIVPMAAVSVAMALTSDHLARPLAAALYWAWLVAGSMGVGLYWWVRRPASRFGPLLVALGVLAWIVSCQASDWPLAFDLGVLAEAPIFVLTFYLFLAFPMGRLEPPAARWLIGALWVVVIAFFLPWLLFSPVIAGAGPLTRCAPACPENVLQVASAPNVVEAAGNAETYSLLAITAAVFVVYLGRLRTASKPQRRSLAAVAATSLLLLPVYFVYYFSAWILKVDQATIDALAWGVAATRALVPVGFLFVLLLAERFAVGAQRALLELLAARPTPDQWRNKIASVLDDAALRLGYYDPALRRFRESDGEQLSRPIPGSGRTWMPIDRDGRPVAAMVIDETLAEDPELVVAAASATLLAVENGQLEGELRAARTRIMQAGDAARRRIERDIHDSAQQRLIALRIHLSLAGEQLDRSNDRAMLERLGVEVDEAIDELRTVAHGIYPQLLSQGVRGALTAVAHRSAMPVSIKGAWAHRQAEVVETTAYFCCVECLQNAAKHAGPGASATVRLSETEDRVSFSVEDDGAGFDPAAAERGAGLTNLADRVAAVGGTLEIDAAPGHGTRITAEIPAAS